MAWAIEDLEDQLLVGSTLVEGSTLTEGEARAVLAGRTVVGHSIREVRELANYRLATQWPWFGTCATARSRLRNRPLVRAWFREFEREVLPEVAGNRSAADALLEAGRLLLWVDPDGQPTCVAARNRELPTGASIGPVYTPPALRARGYATAVVAALSREILAEGKRYVCLFTDLSNPTSNSIYPKIGFRPIADTAELRFPGMP